MTPGRFGVTAARLACVAAMLGLGCSAGGQGPVGQVSEAALGTPGVASAADTSCNVFLRDVADSQNRGGLDANCEPSAAGWTCWVIFTGHVDISRAAVNEGDVPYVLYQSGSDPSWYSAPTLPTTGAGTGFERYQFQLTHHTAVQGQPFPAIQLIPYLATVSGTLLFDHNVYAGNWALDANNGWSIQYDGGYCYEPPPPSTGTVTFDPGYTQATSGALVQGGKLVVNYDLSRLPQCEGVTTDGVQAWATTASAYFLPGKQVLSAAINGPYDATLGRWTSLTFERDIPTDAAQVQLWFETSGDGCPTGWDSDYGQNWDYAITPPSR